MSTFEAIVVIGLLLVKLLVFTVLAVAIVAFMVAFALS